MGFIFLLLRAVSLIVIVDAIASWFVPGRDRFPRNLTGLITEPLYKPIRKVVDPEKLGGIDISPIIVLVALQGIATLLSRIVHG
jgi:YggT family protein